MAVVHHHQPGIATRLEQVSSPAGLGMTVVRVRIYGSMLYAPLAPAFGRALEQAAREFRPDIVHVHLPNLSAFWLLRSGFLASIPWIVHWHADVVVDDSHPALALAYRAYRPLEQAILRRAVRIIATSPPYLQASSPLVRWHGKCTVVPLGIDASRLVPPDAGPINHGQSPFASGTGPKLLFVGRLSSYKGLEYLVRAVQAVPGVILAVAGDGEEGEKINSLVVRLGLESRVKLLGRVDEITKARLLQEADVVCLPSINRHEAFGLVLLEAMCCGTPVIATRVPGSGMQWVVRDGYSGWLVEPREVSAITSLIHRFGDDPGPLRKASAAARKEFTSRFEIGAVADAVIRLYAMATGDGAGVRGAG